MLIQLSSRALRPLSPSSTSPFIGRICEDADLPFALRSREILIVQSSNAELPTGFRAYLFFDDGQNRPVPDTYCLGPEFRYLRHGDVVRLDPKRHAIRALYRRSSPSNSFLVTERCDNYCLMCSQPPKAADDSWLLRELDEVIPLLSLETREIGITGGEPALLGHELVALLARLKQQLPRTAIHVLSNGRRFADEAFAQAVGGVRHSDLMFGIPLYSDLPEEHDYVVQASGAFDDTVRGILNLKRAGVRVELRFVLHRETHARLPDYATFVARNLLFVDHVALMGLELTGFAKTNIEKLWVDPLEYREPLLAAVQTLTRSGVNVSIYNHQLCVLPAALHPFARKSVSDWKNIYFDECATCSRKTDCGGFFASSTIRRSAGITAL